MVVENEISNFFGWLLQGDEVYPPALAQFGLTIAVMAVIALVLGYLVMLVRYGPLKAGVLTYQTVSHGVYELTRISPGRVTALAWLAVKEAMRARVWVGLIVFFGILLFASWFLPTGDYREPGKLYLSFVLTATTYLALLLGLLLSAFSLPNDFKSKTIYTIVTKPVRAGDIVLGRMLGFTLVGTVMLAIMGVSSYVFVNRALDHTHELDRDSWQELRASSGEVVGLRGVTESAHRHQHRIEANPDGYGVALSDHGHDHTFGPNQNVTLGARGFLRARVPQRGSLYFLDANGVRKDRGVNVGNEWQYRSFIRGGSQAAAIWTFSGIDETVLDDSGEFAVLPLELQVRVFRTYKGNINRPIQGSIQLRNPDTKLKNNIQTFGAKDAAIDTFELPREQFDGEMKAIDLIDDLVTKDGRLEVIVQCLEPAQYYGFAQADCYVRLPEGTPGWNFVKGYLGIWVQMVIVITIGVAASTLLNGPIAMMFTASFILLGFSRDFLIGVATGEQPDGTKVYGGGPFESLVRIPTGMNLTKRFDENSLTVKLMKGADDIVQGMLEYVAYILPDFKTLSSVRYVAEGFSIPGPVIGRELAIALAYIIGLAIAGYFFLRTREVAK